MSAAAASCQGGADALALAQIAKSLGQTLRAFQPTIKELQQVSQEFKTAIESEVRGEPCVAFTLLLFRFTHGVSLSLAARVRLGWMSRNLHALLHLWTPR